MDKVIQIANICKDMCNVPNPIPGRIYYAKGCAPALNTCGGVEKTDVFMDKAKVTTPPHICDTITTAQQHKLLIANEGIYRTLHHAILRRP